ncbi:hypothetical protein AB0876_10880 [Mycobacterium sp. NPDC049093]
MTSHPESPTDREGVLVIGAGELGTSVLDALSKHTDRSSELRTLTLMVRPATSAHARRRATTPEDIGTLTAEIVHRQPRVANQIVYLAGDTISFTRLADIVDEVRGTSVTRTEWPLPYLLGELERHPTDSMKKYHAMFAAGRGIAWPKEHSFNVIHGIPTTDTASWARKNLPRLA